VPDGRTLVARDAWSGTDYEPAIRRWERLTCPAPAPLDEKGRLNMDLPIWMMGAPADWFCGLSRTAAIRGAGNGVVVQVAEAVGRWALEGLA
jgi:hypothetical protein